MFDAEVGNSSMVTLADRHARFHELHREGCFVIPNPWDIGSARLLAALGAKALATTSAGFAFTLGRSDMGDVTRDEALAHAEQLVSGTALPVSGDFENGFSDDPEGVAETVRLAGSIGLSGCSIEDTMMMPGHPAYPFDLAVERIRAGAAAARTLGRPFVFCARADGVLNGFYHMDEAVRRIQAFDDAGADLLYVPLIQNVEALRRVVASVAKPVNALAVGEFLTLSLEQFATIGIRRVSLGSTLARLTQSVLVNAAARIISDGDFSSLSGALPGAETDRLLKLGSPRTND